MPPPRWGLAENDALFAGGVPAEELCSGLSSGCANGMSSSWQPGGHRCVNWVGARRRGVPGVGQSLLDGTCVCRGCAFKCLSR